MKCRHITPVIPPFMRKLGVDMDWLKSRCWSGRQDSNLRPSAPKADALPGCATPRPGHDTTGRRGAWWARQDSNPRPSRYERPALTAELQAPRHRCAARALARPPQLGKLAPHPCKPRRWSAPRGGDAKRLANRVRAPPVVEAHRDRPRCAHRAYSPAPARGCGTRTPAPAGPSATAMSMPRIASSNRVTPSGVSGMRSSSRMRASAPRSAARATGGDRASPPSRAATAPEDRGQRQFDQACRASSQ
jgi:hypothetical protein